MTDISKNAELQQSCETAVMRGYFGLDFDFKLTAEKGNIFFISNTIADLLTLSKLDLSKFKMQQFTGVLDRNGRKIYFGDTLTWAWKLRGKIGEEREKLEKEYNELPFEGRLIENKEDFEWLLSSEIQFYWEVLV